MIRIKEILPYLVAEKDGEIYWRTADNMKPIVKFKDLEINL